MKTPSTPGLVLSGLYILASAYLIFTQGLFGESFIAILLGLPWTLGLAYFEFFNASGAVAIVLLVIPMILNAFILYWIGALISRFASR
jgi:hypothetical protein